MKTINLTKKIVGDGILRLSENGEHITNGHWLCRRELLKQAPLLTSVESIEALFPKASVQMVHNSSVQQVIPKIAEPLTLTRTKWIQTMDGANDAVLFVGGEDNATQLWVSREYVDMFKLDELVVDGAVTDCGWDPGLVMKGDEWQIAVMPMRLPDQKGLR